MALKKIKKKNKRMYFDQDVEDAIILYNNTEDSSVRSKIYNDSIKYAFEKLSESIIKKSLSDGKLSPVLYPSKS